MNDLPVCKLCAIPPVNYHAGAFGIKHHCDNKHCTLHNVLFTTDQWRKLMVEPEQEAEPVAQLILSGIDGGEYSDVDIELDVSVAEELQEKLVKNHDAVILPLYAAPPAAQQAKADCNWSYDQDDELWYSGCGHSWVNEDNRDFPGCKFCYNCGGVVTITVEYEPPEQAE